MSSKADNMSHRLCHCVVLSGDDACYDCVINPWRFHIAKAVTEEIVKYKVKYLLMTKSCERRMSDDIHSASFAEIWRHHIAKYKTKCIILLNEAIATAVQKFMERRQKLIDKYIVCQIERVISQHFLILTEKPDAPFTRNNDACNVCKYRECFEPFPPPNFRAWMVEKILSAIDRSEPCLGSNNCKCRSAEYLAEMLMHKWLNASHLERNLMGI